MPTHTSIATAIDKAKLASDVVYLALLEIDVLDRDTGQVLTTLRFAHNDEPYVFQGNTYTSCGFTFRINRGKGDLPGVTLELVDVTQAIQAILQEYQGGTDFPVRLMIVSSANPDAPEFSESFTIMSANTAAEGYLVSFELGAENPLGMRFPWRLMQRNRCNWVYRSVQCGYLGPLSTCDYTRDGPNGCRAHNNVDNFGAFWGIRSAASAV